jgi:hypothetical protein
MEVFHLQQGLPDPTVGDSDLLQLRRKVKLIAYVITGKQRLKRSVL